LFDIGELGDSRLKVGSSNRGVLDRFWHDLLAVWLGAPASAGTPAGQEGGWSMEALKAADLGLRFLLECAC
jgi:hypothetical protein